MASEPVRRRKYVYLPKNPTVFVIQYSNPLWLLHQTFPRGLSGALSSFLRCHQTAPGFLCQRCTATWQFTFANSWGTSEKLGASCRDIMGHSEWAHKVVGSWETHEVVLNLPPTKVFAATGSTAREEGQWIYRGAKFSRRQWTLAPSPHSPGPMFTKFPVDLTYSPGYSTRTAKEHRNPFIPAHFALTREKIEQMLKGKGNRLHMMMTSEAGMTLDINFWSWPSPSYGYT